MKSAQPPPEGLNIYRQLLPLDERLTRLRPGEPVALESQAMDEERLAAALAVAAWWIVPRTGERCPASFAP